MSDARQRISWSSGRIVEAPPGDYPLDPKVHVRIAMAVRRRHIARAGSASVENMSANDDADADVGFALAQPKRRSKSA